MNIGLVFWILMIVSLIFGAWGNRAQWAAGNYVGFGGGLLVYVLLALLGWRVFGPAIHD